VTRGTRKWCMGHEEFIWWNFLRYCSQWQIIQLYHNAFKTVWMLVLITKMCNSPSCISSVVDCTVGNDKDIAASGMVQGRRVRLLLPKWKLRVHLSERVLGVVFWCMHASIAKNLTAVHGSRGHGSICFETNLQSTVCWWVYTIIGQHILYYATMSVQTDSCDSKKTIWPFH